jgi:DNA-binding NarL/FixJ family response regulator
MLDANKSKYIFLFEEAASGSEGIEKIKKNKYDMVIMDYQMPDMNGAETTREMVKLKPNINILALSNYDETLMIKDILNAGAKGYMLKNIDSDELIKAISIILSGKNYYSNEVAVKLIHANDDSINVKFHKVVGLNNLALV